MVTWPSLSQEVERGINEHTDQGPGKWQGLGLEATYQMLDRGETLPCEVQGRSVPL